jgi:RNA polymerase sigma factor (sigma-70 family)
MGRNMAFAPHAIDPEILLRETPWLRALARSLVHDEHEADDVVQSTLLTAVEQPPREPGALHSWLGQVARRLAFRSGQQKRWRQRREKAVAQSEEQGSTSDLVARAALHRQIVEAVLDLAEPYRSTVLLRYFESSSAAGRRPALPLAD